MKRSVFQKGETLALFLLFFFPLGGSSGEAVPEICKWKNDRRAALSLTFDDGLQDQYDQALPLLEKYRFRASFYVSGRMLQDAVAEGHPDNPGAKMTLSELQELRKRGHEIGNHSFHHYQLTRAGDAGELRREINGPIALFQEKLGFKPETFCYPGCSNNPSIERIVLEQHLGAMRWRFACGGKEGSSVEFAEQAVQKTLQSGGHTAFMIHAITAGFSHYPDVRSFELQLQVLDCYRDQLWIDTCAAVMRYELTRRSAKLTGSLRQDGIWSGRLESGWKTPVPLTIRYPSCEAIEVRQNGIVLPVRLHDRKRYFDLLPGTFSIRKLPEKINAMNFRRHVAEIRAEFSTPAEAERAVLCLDPLPGGCELAVFCRWDDSVPAHRKTRELMRRFSFRGTFFFNGADKKLANELLPGGNTLGAHTRFHRWLTALNANAQFKEFMLNRIELECAGGKPVTATAMPFCTFGAPTGYFMRDLGRIYTSAGLYVFPEVVSNLWRLLELPSTAVAEALVFNTRADRIDPEDARKRLAEVQKDSALLLRNPGFAIGIHSIHTENGLKDLAALFQLFGGNSRWWYCNANEYGAYRYSVRNAEPKKLVSGREAVWLLSVYEPAELGATVPLTFRITGGKVLRMAGAAAADGGRWRLPVPGQGALPAMIGLAELDGVSASLRRGADESWSLELRNRTGALLTNIRTTFHFPPVCRHPRLSGAAISEMAPGETRRISIRNSFRPEYHLQFGKRYFAASADYWSGGRPYRIYADCEEAEDAELPAAARGCARYLNVPDIRERGAHLSDPEVALEGSMLQPVRPKEDASLEESCIEPPPGRQKDFAVVLEFEPNSETSLPVFVTPGCVIWINGRKVPCYTRITPRPGRNRIVVFSPRNQFILVAFNTGKKAAVKFLELLQSP